MIIVSIGHVDGALDDQISALLRRDTRELASFSSLPLTYKDTVRRQPSINQKEGPHQNLSMLESWSQNSRSRTMRNNCPVV